jgi:formylglycine-generating enzyme required for sulfatase activity
VRRASPPPRLVPLAAAALVLLLAPAATPGPQCPAEMAPVPGHAACIDRYEASLGPGERGEADGRAMTAKAISRAGAKPAVQVSQLQARAACALAGKRLCLRAEWTAACRGGDAGRKYPYGSKYEPRRCHDRPLAKRRGVVAPLATGSLKRCRTPAGVYDLSGNVWEWLADTRGDDAAAAELVGGGFGNDDRDGSLLACRPSSPFAQPVTQQRPEIGFRCCAELAAR